MLKTEHINLSLYEGSDFVSYLTTYNETMEKIDESIYELQSKISSNELTTTNLSELVKKLQTDMKNADNQIDTIINKCSELESNILDNSSLIDNLQSELTTTNSSVKSILTNIDILTENLNSVESDLQSTTDRIHAEIQSLSKDLEVFITNQNTKNSNFENKITDLQNKTNSIESIVNQLTSSLNVNYKVRMKNIEPNQNIEFVYDDLEFSITQKRGIVGLVISESLENPISAFAYGNQPSISLVESETADFDINVGNKTVTSGVVCPIIIGKCSSNICLITFFVGD